MNSQCNTDGERGCALGVGWNVNGVWCCANHYSFTATIDPKAEAGVRRAAERFVELVALGKLPLRDGYNASRREFEQFPLASAAVERVDVLKRLSAQTPNEKLQRLTEAAEKVYGLRNEAAGTGDRWSEFYNALVVLGFALKINAGQMPATEAMKVKAEKGVV